MDNSSRHEAVAREEAWVEAVRQHVGSLRFGVVQIERTEKIRFDKTEAR